MKRRTVLILLAVVAAAGAMAWGLAAGRKEKILLLSGAIEARDVEVGSLLGGRISKILVEEGSQVAAGQPIARFETDLIDLQIQQQRSKIELAQANLTKALRGPRVEEIGSARAQAENAERERLRQKGLLEKGVTSQQQYDMAATQAKTTREALLQLERGNRPEDIAAARATLQTEERLLAYLERQKAESVVVAPSAGVIESMDLRPGDLVGPNQPVARMLEPSQVWVRVYVPEPQLGRVRLGQKALLTVDTYPKTEFPGKVVEIRTQAEYTPRNVQTLDQRMDQVFGVKVAIDPAPRLKPGMAATVRLVE